MHGMIFSELRQYVEQKHGRGTWETLLTAADLKGRVYLASGTFPDAEAMALVSAASTLTAQTAAALLEGFGMFLVSALMKMHGHMLRPEWKTLDVIEHTERTMHRVVRIENDGAYPPHLKAERYGPDKVLVIYTSPRRMCALAVGIGKGLARHFYEEIRVTQPFCMHSGADRCEILFQRERMPGLRLRPGPKP
jgi:hypothetical protein